MSTSLDKLSEVLLSKMITEKDMDVLVKELKPVVLASLRKEMETAIKNYDLTEAVDEAFREYSWTLAEKLLKQVNITLTPKSKEKK